MIFLLIATVPLPTAMRVKDLCVPRIPERARRPDGSGRRADQARVRARGTSPLGCRALQAFVENTGDDHSAARRSALRKPLPVACEGRSKAREGVCLWRALCPVNTPASAEAAVPGQ